jgi:archaemetzincin
MSAASKTNFKLRNLSETLADAALPVSISTKDMQAVGLAVERARRLDGFFTSIISNSFGAFELERREKNTQKRLGPADEKGPEDSTRGEPGARGFPRMPKPRKGDWLDEHEEPGQPVQRFLSRSSQMPQPHGPYNTIALVIIGAEGFPSELVASLRLYVSSFFLLPVEVLGPLAIDDGDGSAIQRRQHPDTGLQLFAKDCLEFARKAVARDRALSRRVIATMGITMLDLTVNADWNFVYGLASPLHASGCFSMCRFSPSFNGEAVSSAEAAAKIILQRSCKVLTHELTHIFGVKHCVHFQCLMNGANHVGELERQPLLECPLCCRKLLLQLGWKDLALRYRTQALALRKMGFDQEAEFIESVLLPLLDVTQ